MTCEYLSLTPRRIPQRKIGTEFSKISMLQCCLIPHCKNKFHEGIIGSPTTTPTITGELPCHGNEFHCPQASLLFFDRNKRECAHSL